VEYRETIRGTVYDIEGIHERQENGLVEEFGACRLEVSPGDYDCALRFEDSVSPEEVPQQYVGSIEAGVRDGMIRGPTGGYPVTGLRVKCTGGDYDLMATSEEHFRMAALRGLRLAMLEGGSRILEPWRSTEITVPQQSVGAVLADVTSRRGRITGLEMSGLLAIIRADCPVRELRSLAPRLSALTGGRGWFVTRGTRYQELPEEFVSEVIAASPGRTKRKVRAQAQGLQRQISQKTGHSQGVKAEQT